MARTPEFVRWALDVACPLRDNGFQSDWRDPERTERMLRPLRAYANGLADQRIHEGICLSEDSVDLQPGDTAWGFFTDEILQAFDGPSTVVNACSNCPANVSKPDGDSAPFSLAGCYGEFIWPTGESARQIDLLLAEEPLPSLFLPTRPRWYGVWAHSPLSTDQAKALHAALLRWPLLANSPALGQLVSALRAAFEHQLDLHVTLVPPGRSDKLSWTVACHCPRCKAEMRARQRSCHVCGREGYPNPVQKRKARGRRPYQKLSTLLGADGAAKFLQRVSVGGTTRHSCGKSTRTKSRNCSTMGWGTSSGS